VYGSRISQPAFLTGLSGSRNAEAQQDLEKGRSLWQTRDPGDLHRASLLIERAVALDPGSARAHAALADVYAFDYTYWKKAEGEADAAIALDPSLGEPHATIGFIRTFWEWKLVSAEADFKRAIELSPNYATGHQWYALNLAATGHGHAAMAELQQARELEPNSAAINADLCQVMYFQHMFDEAIAQCQATIRTNANFVPAREHLVDAYLAKGLNEEAVNEYLALERIRNGNESSISDSDESIKLAFEQDGVNGFLRMLAAKLSGPLANDYELARIYTRLGDDDRALHWLASAYDKRNFDYVFILADPTFDRFHMRSDIYGNLGDRIMR
jgi:adenylate cyclase